MIDMTREIAARRNQIADLNEYLLLAARPATAIDRALLLEVAQGYAASASTIPTGARASIAATARALIKGLDPADPGVLALRARLDEIDPPARPAATWTPPVAAARPVDPAARPIASVTKTLRKAREELEAASAEAAALDATLARDEADLAEAEALALPREDKDPAWTKHAQCAARVAKGKARTAHAHKRLEALREAVTSEERELNAAKFAEAEERASDAALDALLAPAVALHLELLVRQRETERKAEQIALAALRAHEKAIAEMRAAARAMGRPASELLALDQRQVNVIAILSRAPAIAETQFYALVEREEAEAAKGAAAAPGLLERAVAKIKGSGSPEVT